MPRMTRTQAAPWVHSGGLFAIVAGALQLLTPEQLTWLIEHPIELVGGFVAISRALGMGVARLPHFQPEHRHRQVAITVDRVHNRIESVIDTLAVIQAELDTTADAMTRLRQDTQTLDRA